jgi:hypothetical protein
MSTLLLILPVSFQSILHLFILFLFPCLSKYSPLHSPATPAGITMSKLQILQTPNVYLRNFYVSGTKHQGAGPVYVGLSTNVTFENMTLLQSDTLKCMSFVGSEVSIINSTIDRTFFNFFLNAVPIANSLKIFGRCTGQNMTVGGIFWETLLGTNPGGQTSGSNVTLNHCIVRSEFPFPLLFLPIPCIQCIILTKYSFRSLQIFSDMVNSQIYVDHLSSIVFNRTAFIGKLGSRSNDFHVSRNII